MNRLEAAHGRRFWAHRFLDGGAYYYVTTLVVVLGIVFGHDFVVNRGVAKGDFWDCSVPRGLWYPSIVADGYAYDPDKASNVALFPAYPVAARLLVAAGFDPRVAMVLVSHASLAMAFVMLAAYVRCRWPGDSTLGLGYTGLDYTLLAMGLFPTSLFFRLAYSESLFLLVSIASLYAIQRRWPLAAVAAIVGAGTGTRPVGVALVILFMLFAMQTSATRWMAVRRLLVYTPLACWGILAYMLYLQVQFEEPLAFATTQRHWTIHEGGTEGGISWDKLASLASFRPIWSIFVPGTVFFWGSREGHQNPVFSLVFANPLLLATAILLVVVGARRRWLTCYETWLVVLLLLIPYVTRAHEMGLQSMGRFVAAAFPIYLVIGRMLERLPAPLSALLLIVSALFLAGWSALFAARYPVF